MPIDVRWDDEQPDILLVIYKQPWDWRDYQSGMDRSTVLLEERGHRAHVIADVRQAGLLPKNALSYLRHGVMRNRPANLDKVVIVGLPSLAAMLLQTLRRLYPGAMRDILEANSIETARTLLNELQDRPVQSSDSSLNKP